AEDSVYIGELWRGRGIGRMILADLLVRAEAAGIRVVVARIVEGNPASIRLHEALGFERIGVMPAMGSRAKEPKR
ncbi:MAG: GNAT family N-acetyltransferase, partial [Myxococcales bacterium]|nr:GNAT family N-acetyltransferase [Myxococcales bacterium]